MHIRPWARRASGLGELSISTPDGPSSQIRVGARCGSAHLGPDNGRRHRPAVHPDPDLDPGRGVRAVLVDGELGGGGHGVHGEAGQPGGVVVLLREREREIRGRGEGGRGEAAVLSSSVAIRSRFLLPPSRPANAACSASVRARARARARAHGAGMCARVRSREHVPWTPLRACVRACVRAARVRA
jgi:hypothetical protein